MVGWLVMYRCVGKIIKGRIIAHAAKVLKGISIGWAPGLLKRVTACSG